MIPRIFIRSLRTDTLKQSRRHFTGSSTQFQAQTSPSSKICVVPFRQPPEKAMERLHSRALVASASLGNILYASLLGIFGGGQWVHDLAKQFELGKNLKMKEMKAVYYPIWRCDAVLEGSVKWINDKPSSAWVNIGEAYVPGNAYAPLSYLSFAVPPLDYDLPTYDPSRDLKQLGDGFDIIPVPFTASPLGLIQHLKKAIDKKNDWKGIKFDVPTWKEHLLGCYPLMFPLYIGEFEITFQENDKRSITLIMDAHDEHIDRCRVSFPPLREIYENSNRLKSNYFVNPVPFMPSAQLIVSIDQSDLALNMPFQGFTSDQGTSLCTTYDEYMSPAPTSATSIPPSPMVAVEQEEGGVNWEDPRIQPWTVNNEEPLSEFVELSQRLYWNKAALHAFEKQEADGGNTSDIQSAEGSGTELRSSALEKIAELEKELAAVTPAWMVTYRETQGLEEKIGNTDSKAKQAVSSESSDGAEEKTL